MPKNNSIFSFSSRLAFLFVCWVMMASCGKYFVKNPPANQYYFFKNNIEVKGGNFLRAEKSTLIQRLYGQLEDSAKVKVKKKFFVFQQVIHPTVYDSIYVVASTKNILASMYHLGYYNARINYTADTVQKKVTVGYTIDAGQPTLIDSISYRMKNLELQQLMERFKKESYLKTSAPITKANVITETSRIVDSFRNNGYYKFTAAELSVLGDTAIEALSAVSNDPFTQLQLLTKAEAMKDSPRIRLNIVISNNADSSRLKKYFINTITVLPDYKQGDNTADSNRHEIITKNLRISFHDSLFTTRLIERNIFFKPGELFRQSDYFGTLYNLNKMGVWQSINIQINEIPGTDQVDLVIEMLPTQKYRFETALEVSYSAASNTSNILAGNLFGLSGNISILNRNLAKEAIRMTHNIRAGIEFNNNTGSNGKLINSNEISYTNTTSFPRLIFPGIPNAFNKKSAYNKGESFVNFGVSYNTRLNLFTLQSLNAAFGWSGTNRKDWKWTLSPLNFGFSVFNKSDSFNRIVNDNPFLKYSYNTALVTGTAVSFSKIFNNFNHPHSLSKELSLRFNAEESGLTWGLLPVFKKFKRRYIKLDAEVKHTVKFSKSSMVFRGFVGVGVPLLGSDTNRALPFFKQFFGGGSNSMRAWPVRGIGPGGGPLIPFSSNKSIFNDRTGDAQLELNAEYRYDIARIIPNTLTLRGAVFTDIGNIWNLRSTKGGVDDTTQLRLSTMYQQLGVAAGTGFRLDFNYFVVRLDMGFRFKRPELFYLHDGWQAPKIGFDDFVKKILTRGENDEYRKWRYENFNFTIGIGYSF